MRLISSVILLALAMPVAAQEEEIRSANLAPELEWELLRMYEGGAERHDGPTTVERMRVIRGDVAAMGGPFRIEGRVMGDLVMVDGDVVIEPGGSVTGSITVIGGEVRMGDDAEVGGTITAYATPTHRTDRRIRVERTGDGDGEDEEEWWDWRDRRDRDGYWDRGYSRLSVRAGSSYNRVEGLPIMFGPVIQTAGTNPLRLEALAIWRSESLPSLDTDRMGYSIRAEQFLFGERRFSVGATYASVVEALDRWQVTDLEASLAAVVFHEDFRDYFDRSGWSAFVRAEPARWIEATVEYRDERHNSIAAGDPWSLFHREDVWRAQPLMAEGSIRTVTGALELDLRDRPDDPARGWYGRFSLERPVGGRLERPALPDVVPFGANPIDVTPGTAFAAERVSTDFTSGLVDLRRYNLVGYDSQLNFRVVAGGSVTGERLPSQFQHALGGLGTLPGYDVFHADCGARGVVGTRGSSRFFPSYGCDRFALGQVEYRGDLSLDFGIGDPDYRDDDWWDDVEVDLSPTWVVFMDAAQGWAYADPAFGPERDTGVLVDAGLGFLIEDVGIYAALPITGDAPQEPRFFIRLGRRF